MHGRLSLVGYDLLYHGQVSAYEETNVQNRSLHQRKNVGEPSAC